MKGGEPEYLYDTKKPGLTVRLAAGLAADLQAARAQNESFFQHR
jgi:hypothetical protein